ATPPEVPAGDRPRSATPVAAEPGSARAAAAADRPTEGPTDDVDHLVDIRIGFAMLGGRPHAALDVVLEDEDGEGVDGGPEGGGLLEDVDAVLLALDHPGDPADLAFHPGEAPDQPGLVLRIAVANVRRCD